MRGVVTAETGRLGSPLLIAIQDGTGGIVIRVPEGARPPRRGSLVTASGPLHDPYGQLEIRPDVTGFAVVGTAALPHAAEVDGAALGEATEGRLVSLEGTVDGAASWTSSGDLTVDLLATDGTAVRLFADESSGIEPAALADGATYRVLGVAGQRASRKGSLDGYRIWIRDGADILLIAAPAADEPDEPNQTDDAGASRPPGTPVVATVTIARALLVRDGEVRIEATVSAGPALLDATGRRIVVEDGTAAIEVLVPTGTSAPSQGTQVTVTGTVGRAYGAPRLRATELATAGAGVPIAPLELRGAPGPAHEWRLVRVSGTIIDVTRMGSRWRAELEIAGDRVPIAGLSGAGIPSSTLREGARATFVGIVRRPHPSATDRRFAVTPRSPGDVSVGPTEPGASGAGPAAGPGAGAGGRGIGPGANADGSAADGRPTASGGPGQVVDVDIADLDAHVGMTVRIGGLVVELLPDGLRLDDGTAVGQVVLAEEAAELLPLIEIDDPLNATGLVERRGDVLVVVVADPAGISRVGDLLAPAPIREPDATPTAPSGTISGRTAGGAGAVGLGGPQLAVAFLLMILAGASVAMTVVRRRRVQRAWLGRVATRLASIAGPPARPIGEQRAPAVSQPSEPGR